MTLLLRCQCPGLNWCEHMEHWHRQRCLTIQCPRSNCMSKENFLLELEQLLGTERLCWLVVDYWKKWKMLTPESMLGTDGFSVLEVLKPFVRKWFPGLVWDEINACDLVRSLEMILFMPPATLAICCICREGEWFWRPSNGEAVVVMTRRITGSRRPKDMMDDRSKR